MTKFEVLEKCRQILMGSGLSTPLKDDDFNFLRTQLVISFQTLSEECEKLEVVKIQIIR